MLGFFLSRQNVIELVKSADTSSPAPLEEGLSYNIYSSFIAMPPAAELETEVKFFLIAVSL